MIEATGLSKTFPSGRGRVSALSDISFRVEAGQSLILAGKSGSGKTTLLHCLGGLERPDQGRVICAGTDITGLSRKKLAGFQRRHIGFVFQAGNLLSCLTVRQNIAFPLELNGISGKAQAGRIDELLEQVNLAGIGEALPKELSGGETQRAAFARAIAHSPAVLLADEPTASLDSANGRQLVDLMVSLSRQQQCTLVVSTHDPDLMTITDHRLVLSDGRKEELS